MSDQNIHSKINDAAQNMHVGANSSHLETLEIDVKSVLTPRYSMGTRKEFRRALFQAALNGDILTLDALSGHKDATDLLIDHESCDNALWVAVAENHTHFAITLLQTPSMREKITLPGVKEVIRLGLNGRDKGLINALLQFVAESEDEKLPQQVKPAC